MLGKRLAGPRALAWFDGGGEMEAAADDSRAAAQGGAWPAWAGSACPGGPCSLLAALVPAVHNSAGGSLVPPQIGRGIDLDRAVDFPNSVELEF